MDHLTQLAQFTIDDARALLPGWQQALRAEDKSPGTIDTYTDGPPTLLDLVSPARDFTSRPGPR